MTETERVLVVAKAPWPGRSKTRLVPPLDNTQAAALHEALLLDTLDACRTTCDDVRLLCPSSEDADALARLAPTVSLERQRGRGLADALALGLAGHTREGLCAIVSSDIPGLPPDQLGRAFSALREGADVVLGPAHDGGYWLIAMREPHAEPFVDVPWSTPAVAGVTRARCRAAGLALVELEPWRDVDTLVDLAAIPPLAERAGAHRTCALLTSLGDIVPPALALELRSSEVVAGSPWRAILRDGLDVGGSELEYSYLAVPRAVFVAAVTAAEELLLVRQYRHPVRDWTLEVPAGSLVDGESPLEAAARELREETGGVAQRWTHLSTFFSSSAHLSLRSDAFLAEGVEVGAAAPEPGEDVTLVRMALRDAVVRARAGGFPEGQTALTILLAAERLTS